MIMNYRMASIAFCRKNIIVAQQNYQDSLIGTNIVLLIDRCCMQGLNLARAPEYMLCKLYLF